MEGIIDKLYMKAPCGKCPFKKNCMKGWLGEDRAKEVAEATTFVCHKDNSRQCSGAMQMNSENNEFVILAGIMKIDIELKNREAIFDSKAEMIQHHKN